MLDQRSVALSLTLSILRSFQYRRPGHSGNLSTVFDTILRHRFTKVTLPPTL